MRLSGNWLEATGTMPVPTNLGTPGAPNSRLVSNAGPAISEVTHSPSLPAANQAAVVTARVHDPQGVQSLTLNYRVDPADSIHTQNCCVTSQRACRMRVTGSQPREALTDRGS